VNYRGAECTILIEYVLWNMSGYIPHFSVSVMTWPWIFRSTAILRQYDSSKKWAQVHGTLW